MRCKKNIKWTATSNMVVKSAALELPMLNSGVDKILDPIIFSL